MIGSKVVKRKLRGTGWMFIIMPTVAGFIAGLTNYYTMKFGVYLKYQAMVDTYYDKVFKL